MSVQPIRVLVQTTIPYHRDDWCVERFSLLCDVIANVQSASGQRVEVTARDHSIGRDSVLESIDRATFDQVWLLGVDAGTGLSANECEALSAFYRAGGGLLIARDHADLGLSTCEIADVGRAHHFHSHNPEGDESRRSRDHVSTKIDWPNYQSGANGAVQRIALTQPVHPLMKDRDGRLLEFFPAHPHEGAVGIPSGEDAAQVLATGTSQITGRSFNLAVAFESSNDRGRAIAESSFHHFCDYNWDPRMGCPSFVEDIAVDDVVQDPALLRDVHAYVRSAVLWLARAD